MSEIPTNPEHGRERHLSEDKLVDLQGAIDRFVIEDDERKDLGKSLLSSQRQLEDNIEDVVAVQWYKDEARNDELTQIHAKITHTVGPEGQPGSVEKFSIGLRPEQCYSEFMLGSDEYRAPLDDQGADELIRLLERFRSK